MAFALVFPGQGSQFVGMGVDLANNFTAAKKVFQEVDDSLKQSLFKIISDGPESDLMLTENTQPALMAVSMAFVSVLNQESGYPIVAKSTIL
ncbi:MAG TPA: acyltransferase domain-containing protein, partial [Alphaproteobacteria bacterium]|nr:acyltransferase domain-containing protein [Alphaproteobacteria bacterium]